MTNMREEVEDTFSRFRRLIGKGCQSLTAICHRKESCIWM